MEKNKSAEVQSVHIVSEDQQRETRKFVQESRQVFGDCLALRYLELAGEPNDLASDLCREHMEALKIAAPERYKEELCKSAKILLVLKMAQKIKERKEQETPRA